MTVTVKVEVSGPDGKGVVVLQDLQVKGPLLHCGETRELSVYGETVVVLREVDVMVAGDYSPVESDAALEAQLQHADARDREVTGRGLALSR